MKKIKIPLWLRGNKGQRLSYSQAMEIVNLVLNSKKSVVDVANEKKLWRTTIYNVMNNYK